MFDLKDVSVLPIKSNIQNDMKDTNNKENLTKNLPKKKTEFR